MCKLRVCVGDSNIHIIVNMSILQNNTKQTVYIYIYILTMKKYTWNKFYQISCRAEVSKSEATVK